MARTAKRGVIPMGYSVTKTMMTIPAPSPKAKIVNAANKAAKVAIAAMFPFSTAYTAAKKIAKKPPMIKGGGGW
jgi:hypothetical protein